MAEHCGYVVRVEKLRPHGNADKLQILTVFSTDVIVSTDVKYGDIGVYFPSDLQLGEKFCQVNDLVRRKDENGNTCGGYLDPVKRNIKALKLRGEQSDGLYLPLSYLSAFTDIDKLKVGDTVDTLGGEVICCKYIPATNKSDPHTAKAKERKPRVSASCPFFKEHVETEQLVHHLSEFHEGDDIEITLKMHGTSQRTGYLPVTRTKRNGWLRRLLHLPPKTHTEYEYISGSRRVVLGERKAKGFYDSDDWRYAMEAKFVGQLRKGETVYYEVVGFQGHGGAPIMGAADNKTTRDKAFIQKYGDRTVFSYGCDPSGIYADICGYSGEEGLLPSAPCCEVYVYRMTMTNPDGFVMEYSPEQMRQRCGQMGVKYVMEFDRFRIPKGTFDAGAYVKAKAEQYYDGADPIGQTHIREGVVIRIVNRPGFVVFKHKNISFKILSGLIAEQVKPDEITDETLLEEM